MTGREERRIDRETYISVWGEPPEEKPAPAEPASGDAGEAITQLPSNSAEATQSRLEPPSLTPPDDRTILDSLFRLDREDGSEIARTVEGIEARLSSIEDKIMALSGAVRRLETLGGIAPSGSAPARSVGEPGARPVPPAPGRPGSSARQGAAEPRRSAPDDRRRRLPRGFGVVALASFLIGAGMTIGTGMLGIGSVPLGAGSFALTWVNLFLGIGTAFFASGVLQLTLIAGRRRAKRRPRKQGSNLPPKIPDGAEAKR
ncbi:MAG: hypothetical protein ACRDI1_02565 [Actinomycetota bacterium]